MGAGLAGLSAGYALTQADKNTIILEADSEVGGLAKTISWQGFQFDLGGHRFLTDDKNVWAFVKKILKKEYLTVSRSSKILLLDKYFDYPLKPANALFGLGPLLSLQMILGYLKEQIRNKIWPKTPVSLKDWVIHRFGKMMYTIYFKPYSEKVWGVRCENISQEWVAQRIKGLSLGAALKNAFFKYCGGKIPTLADKFIYPRQGIGQISKNLESEIEKKNSIYSNCRVTGILHDGTQIKKISFQNGTTCGEIESEQFLSSIPLTRLVQLLDPPAPEGIQNAVKRLQFRDLVVVTLMLDMEHVTDLSWLYFPQKDAPFARIHEPKNWSPEMAPSGKTHLVAEYFCTQGCPIWSSDDTKLTTITATYLEEIGLIKADRIIGSYIVRVPNAYPVLSVSYNEDLQKISGFLKNFRNLQVIGRGGMFKYSNIDQVISAGLFSAQKIIDDSLFEN